MRRPLPLLLVASFLAWSPAPARAAPPARVRLVHYYAGALQDALERLVQEFNASQSKVAVEVEFVPFGDLKRHLLVANASGDLPDVVILDNPDTAFFAASGVFADVTDRVRHWPDRDRFFAGPWRSNVYRGRQYGLPFTSNTLALFYDRGALERARVRVPETWEELRTAARRLTTPDRYGMAIAAVRSEEGTFQFLPWFLSAGASVDRLDSAGAVRALEFLHSLIEDGSMSREVIGWTQFDVQKQFSAGKAAMAVNGPWALAQVERDAHGRELRWGVARIPRDVTSASPLGGENVAITRQADLDAAWTVVAHLASREFQERFARTTGFLSARKDVEAGRDDPRLEVFIRAMPSVVPRGPHPRWPELSDLVSGALQEGLSGSATPRAALEKAQQGLTALRAAPFSSSGEPADAP